MARPQCRTQVGIAMALGNCLDGAGEELKHSNKSGRDKNPQRKKSCLSESKQTGRLGPNGEVDKHLPSPAGYLQSNNTDSVMSD